MIRSHSACIDKASCSWLYAVLFLPRQGDHGAKQVVWVDLLSRAEFEAGFGSHTPIFTGQTKCECVVDIWPALKGFEPCAHIDVHAGVCGTT